MTVRHLIRIVHRDTGYFLFGLVVSYAVSGLAVNHIETWNPTYATTVTEVAIGPLESESLEGVEREVVARLGLDPAAVTGRHRPAPGEFVVFLPHGGEARVALATGRGTLKRVRTRPFLFEANALHLNRLKGVWTYVADGFAVLLLALACTGLFMLKGGAGLAGRGKWFVAAGLLLPVGFLYYYVTR
ncbi:MAG: PepSY-associated TM helix domain-containing protein [Planctomycetota bacterium]|jgi:hypothetical protein